MSIIENDSFDALSLKYFLSVIPEHWIIRKVIPSSYGMLVRIELFIKEHASGLCFNVWLKSLTPQLNTTINNVINSQSQPQKRLTDVPTEWLSKLYQSNEIDFIAVHSKNNFAHNDLDVHDSDLNNSNKAGMYFVLADAYINNRLCHLLPNWWKLATVSIEFPETNTLHDIQGQNKMEVLAKHRAIKASGIQNRQEYMRFSSLLTLYLQRVKDQKAEIVLKLVDGLSMTQKNCTTQRCNNDNVKTHSNISQSTDDIIQQMMPKLEISDSDRQQFYQQISLFDEISNNDTKQTISSLFDILNQPQELTPY